MKEIRWIEANICQYVFLEHEDMPSIDINITVLINGKNALLIDAAFTSQALAVKEDLMSKGIVVDEIILSHYHPDHAAGATSFPDARLSCSVHYEENYNRCSGKWNRDHAYRKPEQMLQSDSQMDYGDFSLSFLEAPGHSTCSLITIIKSENPKSKICAHVGDLIMSDVDGRPGMPYISLGGNFKKHVDSLEQIKTLNIEKLILAHGEHIEGKEVIANAINMRIHYLKSMIETGGQADLDDALLGGQKKWAFTKWHKYNVKHL